MTPDDGLDALELLLRRPEWHGDAACRGVGPDAFFPERGERTDAAELCASCPVRLPCLLDALPDGGTRHGIWGGTSHRQRRRMRQQSSTTVCARAATATRRDAARHSAERWSRNGHSATARIARRLCRLVIPRPTNDSVTCGIVEPTTRGATRRDRARWTHNRSVVGSIPTGPTQ
jgi:WhiB family redox-sensing transcriptional regulator